MQEAAARFVRVLALAIQREGEPSARAAEAHEALSEVLSAQKSLVLDVQFTGFTSKGQPVGAVDPVVLRSAGHLITLRINRIGFTPDASAEDLEAVFAAAARGAGELGAGGLIGALADAAPHGVYASTAAGDVYKPAPRRAAPPAEAPPSTGTASVETSSAGAVSSTDTPSPSEAPAFAPAESAADAAVPAGTGASVWMGDDFERTELAEFEILDPFQELVSPAGGEAPAADSDAPAGDAPREEPSSGDMYHFFRAAGSDRRETEALPRLLRETANMSRYDELADAAAWETLLLLRSDAQAQAVEIIDTLVDEAQRADRSRLFRESAGAALKRIGNADTLQRLAEGLSHGSVERDRILRFFSFAGGDAVALLEATLFRTADAELRGAVFRSLIASEGAPARLISAAVQDAGAVRVRTLLELVRGPGVDAELGRKWATEAAAHRDPAVRADAARTAASLGGRGSMRLLLDLLGDTDRTVKREAVQGLGAVGEVAAVPFLTRTLNEGDEELQIASAQALGRLGSAEALPALLAIVTKRSLLSLKKVTKPKLAALQAIARISAPAARDALQSVAGGRDELAEEARRLLATL
ncbi:HEAT repeat domain-containing protein [Longimicrobium terrae]|uniref:HEAT repeat protein n=1 Tax=Longimicrobium terrae TaxID=1639882 RepID=A0A841H4J9_9BACT|nr:HEAT repeat domain-containing protein [Longimicrobium terrae]MBB4638658.1 HEAT repeat protein [Longimicrobium terrae]MBB6072898.1 HEAT repeat protein [Longimicrobium terrae]NNC31511.1 HEAT repeat domain-containing protein [Longimicrobium terrae]